MSFLFPQDDGPSAAEVLAEQQRQAKRRQQGINQQAERDKNKGVSGQLLGARRNPSQKLPGSSGS